MRALLRWPRLSLLDIAALALPVWVWVVISHTNADPDLWGHLRFGSDILRAGRLPLQDRYAFTSDVPWINHEWLSEVAFAAAYFVGGAAALTLLKLAIIGTIAALAWRAARRSGASVRLAAVLTSVIVFTSYTRTQVLRPQLFSVLFFAVMLELLDERFGWKQRFIGMTALFCAWVNTHGGWIVGYGALGAWICGDALERRSLRSVLPGLALLAAGAAATLLNPYGAGMWTFLGSTVGLSRTDITDWAPLLQLPPAVIAIDAILPAMALASAVVLRRIPPMRHSATIAALAIGTWRVGRVDAFLHIAVGLLMMPVMVEALGRLSTNAPGLRRLSHHSPVNAAAAAVLLYIVAVHARPLTYIAVTGSWIPDREAVRFLRTDPQPSRLLTWFDWGEYAIWHLSPAGFQVSIDGRRETVYSRRVLDDHWAFYRNDAGAWQYPDRIGADRIWLPRRLPVVPILRQHGWNVDFESDRSVVLSRERRHTLAARSHDPSPTLFPAE
jgi:hypothetical protein